MQLLGYMWTNLTPDASNPNSNTYNTAIIIDVHMQCIDEHVSRIWFLSQTFQELLI